MHSLQTRRNSSWISQATSRRESFNHGDFIFELKYDGFRALAHLQDGTCQLVSRNRNVFKRFARLADETARTRRPLGRARPWRTGTHSSCKRFHDLHAFASRSDRSN
jgi:hypothetical protein